MVDEVSPNVAVEVAAADEHERATRSWKKLKNYHDALIKASNVTELRILVDEQPPYQPDCLRRSIKRISKRLDKAKKEFDVYLER